MRFYQDMHLFCGAKAGLSWGVLHMITETENQCLRMIAEMLAEKVDAARILCVGVHADDDGDIVVLPDIQIFDGHVADAFVVQKTALVRDAPCFQEAELRGENRPPFRREPSAASAAVAGACPYAQPLAVDGNGNITINGKSLDEYFGTDILKVIVKQPLTVTNTISKYDVICKVEGGGFTGQAGAIRHGIARALLEANSEYRPVLKSNGFLTRDPRMKERKKYGLKKARKAPQFSKR